LLAISSSPDVSLLLALYCKCWNHYICPFHHPL
jgi:hypothetical protein